MAFRKFTATQVFDGYRLLETGQVLVTTEDGIIEAILPEAEAGGEVQAFDGILSPGLINCHCHLELSHLKNVIPPHTGLIDFLCSVVTKRGFAPELVQQEIKKAEREMYDNGIVAVGDIGNTADTALAKSMSRISWQNFVEVLSFTDAGAEENMKHYGEVAAKFEKAKSQKSKVKTEASPQIQSQHHKIFSRTALVPHAPYSISPRTFEMLNEATGGEVISVHNQEHPDEDELYKTGGGGFLRLFRIFGVDKSPFPVTGKTSLQSWLPHFTNGQTIFLVHNTYMSGQDMEFANVHAAKHGLSLVYCLCPNANLYIEDRVPPVDLLISNNCTLVLGTDSYSSNWQLSIAKEMQAIHKHFPALPLETILQWATLNGAKALRWQDSLGSFEKGKQPGVVLLKGDLSASKRIL